MEVFTVLVHTPSSCYIGGVFTNRDKAIKCCNKIFKEQHQRHFFTDLDIIKTNDIDEYSLYETDECYSLLVSVDKFEIYK